MGNAISVEIAPTESAVPDVLAPDLEVVFCGINPGRVSAAAAAHFANPRNDFWRLLHDAGFTPRLYAPREQLDLLSSASASRTPPTARPRARAISAAATSPARRNGCTTIAHELRPRAVAFVGKEAYRGTFGERAELGPQLRTLDDVGLFVLPSTSPANAAVPYPERLRWFRALREWLVPVEREAVRALVVDRRDRTLLVQFRDDGRPGVVGDARRRDRAGRDGGADLAARARGGGRAHDVELGPELWTREHVFAWAAASFASASAFASCASTSTSRRRRSTSAPSG